MHLNRWFRQLLTLTVLAGFFAQSVHAQNMVSVRNNTVNLRISPSTSGGVTWQLSRGYPLQILQKRTNWLHVQDFEGDQGWVARRVTSSTPHHIVKVQVAHLRQGPGTHHPIVGKAVYGEVLRTVRRKNDWVAVRAPQGGQTVWVARRLLWGW